MQTGKAALFIAILGLAASTGFASRNLLAPTPAPAGCMTVAETAQAAGLNLLATAVEAAGLTSVIADPNLAYTVFAPTDEAFTNALTALNLTAEEVLASPELTPILQNHLLAYPLKSTDLIAAGTVNTQDGFKELNITAVPVSGETIVEVSTPLITANVIKADITACKSIVHVIDEVLLPVL
jgi:uncharacterized surface protein with fasciclin (FAS1) repeats